MDYDGVYLNEVVAGEQVVIGRITEEAEADLDLLTYLERNGVGPNVALNILAVDRMSGAVTAVTGAGKEIRLEGRSAALIWARRAEDAGVQPETAPGAILDRRSGGGGRGNEPRTRLTVCSRPLPGRGQQGPPPTEQDGVSQQDAGGPAGPALLQHRLRRPGPVPLHGDPHALSLSPQASHTPGRPSGRFAVYINHP